MPLSSTAAFLLQLVVIIGLARLLGLIGRRLRQPLVVAEIAAGIVLGPSVLGAIHPELLAALFPESAMPILHSLSELGLVLFMFLVGLEMDSVQVRRHLRTAALVSVAGVVVPFGAVALLSPWLHRELSSPEVPLASFTLFLGVAISITAFPALARLLTEWRLVGTKIGAIAISAAAIDDITAWCVLAAVVSVGRARDVTSAVTMAVLALVATGAALFVLRPLLARLAARVEHRSGLTENTIAFVLLALLAASLVTEAVGVHALFGAFVFGAVFPRQGGIARALAQRVEDLTTTILLPIFFVYSGLRTQIGLLDGPREWGLCGVIILVAMAGKVGGSMVASRRSGLSWRESAAIATLMNTRGPMELVVLHVGLGLGVLSPALFTMLVLMALVTTALAAPLLRLLAPSGVAMRGAAEDGPAPTASAPAAVVYVEAPESGPALAVVSRALIPSGRDSIIALHVASASDRTSWRLDEGASGEAVLEPIMEHARALGLSARGLSFASARVGPDICATAAVKGASWVLLGADDESALDRDTVGHVLRHATTGVAVLVGPRLAEVRRVFVPRESRADGAAARLVRRIARNAEVPVIALSEPTAGERPTSATADLVVIDFEAGQVRSDHATLAAAAVARGIPVLFVRDALPEDVAAPSVAEATALG